MRSDDARRKWCVKKTHHNPQHSQFKLTFCRDVAKNTDIVVRALFGIEHSGGNMVFE